MSYFGLTLYVGNRAIEDLIKELQKIKKENKGKKITIGDRICDNECDMYGECTCNVYSIHIEGK